MLSENDSGAGLQGGKAAWRHAGPAKDGHVLRPTSGGKLQDLAWAWDV